MAGPAIDHLYRYTAPSVVEQTDSGARLSLATSGIGTQPDLFFRGSLTKPRLTADLLLALVRVVQSRFHLPANMLARILAAADPVVTCGQDRIRFEAFSVCCGVYGRVDLLPDAVNGALLATGTTNVDFNPPMRAALAKLQDSMSVGLSVGSSAVGLEVGEESVVERKVALPVRWLKGFVEVQAHQARMEPRFEIAGTEARRFLQSLPRGGAIDRPAFITRAGGGIRISMLGGAGGIRVGGIERLRILEDIVRHVKRLRVYAARDSEASGWEVETDVARFFLVLSPEIWRGFSGEGQALEQLGNAASDSAVASVRQALGWKPRIDVGELSSTCRLEPTAVRSVLAQLGASGLVGYDLAEGAYFHRELPFDLSQIERLQPRLKGARQLIDSGGIQIISRTNDAMEAWVRGTDVEHHVRIAGDSIRCTCPWFAKHPGDRGPCKHILAVQILTSESDDA